MAVICDMHLLWPLANPRDLPEMILGHRQPPPAPGLKPATSGALVQVCLCNQSHLMWIGRIRKSDADQWMLRFIAIQVSQRLSFVRRLPANQPPRSHAIRSEALPPKAVAWCSSQQVVCQRQCVFTEPMHRHLTVCETRGVPVSCACAQISRLFRSG